MAILSRDEILAADDVVKELVEVPEWGGSVWVRTPTGAARDDFEASLLSSNGDARSKYRNIRARFCAQSICDDSGALLFSARDVEELGKKSAAALDRVFTVAQRLSGMTAEELKEIEGNLPGEGSSSSGSTSPEPSSTVPSGGA